MLIVGHRGARGLAPENTIASLQKALEHGADMLEFDVRITKDGIPVLHHDPDLKDASGAGFPIADHMYNELKAHKPDLATLEDVFTQVSHHAQLYIEAKPGISVVLIVEMIKKYLKQGWKPEQLYLASKNQAVLVALHQALPELPTIVIEPWSGMRAGRRAAQLNTKYVAMNQLWLWKWFIKPVTTRGWKLMAYTLNNPKKARRWERYGLYAVITDFPDRFEK